MPAVYSSLERELTATAAARQAPLRVAHYRREGWTYHAKGLWLWPPAGGGTAAPPASVAATAPLPADAAPPAGAAPPSHPADAPAAAMGGGDDAARPILSLLGSSNLGHRSVHLHLDLAGLTRTLALTPTLTRT